MKLVKNFVLLFSFMCLGSSLNAQLMPKNQDSIKKGENKSVKVENNNTTRPHRRKQAPTPTSGKEEKRKKIK